MQDKLQELTDRLYKEGLNKGKEEAEKILEAAKAEAKAIVAAAKEEASGIIKSAEKEAEALKMKVEDDLKMAGVQSIQATRNDIENLISGKIAGAKVKDALKDSTFVKEILQAVAKNFDSQSSCDLAVVLPESLRDQLESYVTDTLASELKNGIHVDFSRKIAGGFNIGPKDGGYFISMTDEALTELVAGYMRPVSKKILFG